MADIVIKQIEEGMTGRQVADLLYSNFLALVGAIGSGGGGDIPVADIEKGVTAYGWGDHRQAGYLKGITGGMVTGALGYTPMDEAAWTKANIKATLGIADWALAASKPTYKTSEVAEDGNLYFTDARAVAALAGVTNALAGDIGANATAIGVLQGYFTNGVAKSAAKLQTARKLWGQSFDGTADVTGALTSVTDITASGTLTIGKIKIGDGVIEWDASNGGFKVTGGLWATDYLSSKGVNTGASGGGGGSSYQRLDTWDGYTTAKDGWVLSAKLGYGLKTTQDDILRQLADISGQGTNVTFTPALTSGTQIGTLTIDGEPVKMYAPTIPTNDINKGVTAYGWGNHASVGYAMASALGGYQTKITSSNKLDYSLLSGVPTKLSQFTNDLGLGTFAYKSSLAFADLTGKPTTIGGYGITDAYTASTIDTKLGGYLPLSGGTIKSSSGGVLAIDRTGGGESYIKLLSGGTYKGAVAAGNATYGAAIYNSTCAKYLGIKDDGTPHYHGNTLIHSGNIGSQSVHNAAKFSNHSITDFAEYNDGGSYIAFNLLDTSLHAKGQGDGYIKYYDNGKWYNSVWGKVTALNGFIGNATSATKLQAARSIWGQSFDGTGNVSGDLHLSTSKIYWWGDAANYCISSVARENSSPYLNIAHYGGISFNTAGYEQMYISGSGNVGIGTYNPKAKLDVEGGLFNRSWHYIYNSADRTDRLCLAWNKGTACIYSIKADGSSYNSLRLGTTADGNRQLYHDSSTGNWGVGTSTPQYKLDVNGTLHASSTVTFDGALKVGGVTSIGAVQAQYDANRAQLSVISTANQPAMFWLGSSGEKKWSVESSGEADSYRFSLYSWVVAKHILKLEHSGVATLDGTFNATTGIWSDGYVSAKGQNTSSDMRLKRVLEEVTLSVDEIAAAPAVRFAWKGGGGVDVGTSAQYWEKLLPDVVKRDDAGWLTMQYGNAAMVAVIALARRVQELEEKLKIKN